MASPYPSMYIPKGGTRPRHCPHVDIHQCLPGKGPDAIGGGLCFGQPYHPNDANLWRDTGCGYWLRWEGATPQQLLNLLPSERITTWRWIDGCQLGQRWRVPVFFELIPNEDGSEPDLAPCVNRIWDGEQYTLGQDLQPIVESLLALACGHTLADTLEANNQAIVDLVQRILAIGHHVGPGEFKFGQWLDEALITDVIATAVGQAVSRRHQPLRIVDPDELLHAG